MSDLLQALHEVGAIDRLDLHFARAVGRLAQVTSPAVLAAAALANRAPTHGHVCAQLHDIQRVLERELGLDLEHDDADGPAEDRLPLPPLPDPDAWIEAVRAAPRAFRRAGEDRATPLVEDEGAVYLDRYWRYEDTFTAAIRARVADPVDDLQPQTVRAGLDQMFDGPWSRLPRLACATALLNRFTVVSGGPGTGKTSVVVRMLALLNHVARERGEALPRVMLVAPTGKASARLTESIQAQMSDDAWVPPAMQGDLDMVPSTIHSALGVVRFESPQFRHNAANPLPVDVLVVDEASMVDLPLMAKLVDAVPPSARLILLGDPDQLVSVELGSVLGDVCAAARAGVRSQAATDALRAAGADCPDGEGAHRSLTDVHVHLEHTWRYGDDSGIKAIATAIQANEGARVVALLDGETHQDVVRVDPPTSQHGWEKMLRGSLVERYTPAVTATAPEPALEALGAFRVLCAHRRGIRGVARVNDSVEAWLQDAGKIRAKELWYPGRPVMITRTDRTLKLRNGDVGIVGVDPDDPTGRLAWFPGERDPALRRFRTAALPEHDTVYATTVHKAQGSEYDEVLVILPDKRSPVVTRELLYTAVTRARSRVRVLGSAAVIEAAVGVTIERMTGLRQKLAAAP